MALTTDAYCGCWSLVSISAVAQLTKSSWAKPSAGVTWRNSEFGPSRFVLLGYRCVPEVVWSHDTCLLLGFEKMQNILPLLSKIRGDLQSSATGTSLRVSCYYCAFPSK